MTSSSVRPHRGGLSLEYKLPLLITALLTVTMAAGVVFAHAEVKRSAIGTASERLELISRQLADLAALSVPRRIAAVRGVADDPAVAALLAAPDSASRAAAAGALQRLRSDPEDDLRAAVRGPDGRPLLTVGTIPEADDVDVWEAVPDSTGVGRILSIGGRAYYWVTAGVGPDGAAGSVAELRRIGGSGTSDRVETLLGRDIELFFANRAGGSWVALGGIVEPAPASWPFSGAARYGAGSGGEHLGHADPIPGSPWSVIVHQPLGTVLSRSDTFLRRSRVAALLLGLAGAVGAWLLSRSITRPLRELRLASEAIARGDYGRRIDLRRSDELGTLADRFDWMAGRVQSSHAELTEQYRTARSLAEELERTNARLEHALAEAEAASRIKSDFLATMSHEIRTPINAIIGYTDLLELGLAGPVSEKQRAQLERIRISGRHLIGLVDQVLDFARIESGTLRVERRPAPAADAVRTALTVLRPQAGSKGVHLTADCDDVDLHYLGDPHRVDQILVNLASNALKFTEPEGRISIRCAAEEGTLPSGAAGRWTCLTVEDTGIGIHPEQLRRIFEPFFQIDSGYTRRHEGTGLGLAISLRFARSMGGDLTVHSAPGEGSSFTLWLPAAEPEEAAPGEDAADAEAEDAPAPTSADVQPGD